MTTPSAGAVGASRYSVVGAGLTKTDPILGGPEADFGLAIEFMSWRRHLSEAVYCEHEGACFYGWAWPEVTVSCAVVAVGNGPAATATFYGGAPVGYKDYWVAFRITDRGRLGIDRIGIDITDRRINDGRCGAGRLPTTPLLAGDFTIRSWS